MKYKHFLEALNTLNDDGGSQHLKHQSSQSQLFNPLKPNDLKIRRTAQLTYICCIL